MQRTGNYSRAGRMRGNFPEAEGEQKSQGRAKRRQVKRKIENILAEERGDTQRPEGKESRELSKTMSVSEAKATRWSRPVSIILAKLRRLDFQATSETMRNHQKEREVGQEAGEHICA